MHSIYGERQNSSACQYAHNWVYSLLCQHDTETTMDNMFQMMCQINAMGQLLSMWMLYCQDENNKILN